MRVECILNLFSADVQKDNNSKVSGDPGELMVVFFLDVLFFVFL